MIAALLPKLATIRQTEPLILTVQAFQGLHVPTLEQRDGLV